MNEQELLNQQARSGQVGHGGQQINNINMQDPSINLSKNNNGMNMNSMNNMNNMNNMGNQTAGHMGMNQDMNMNMNQGYQNMNNMGMNNMGGMNIPSYNQQMQGPSDTDFTKNLILSVVQLMCCCQVTGIVALIMCILSNTAYKQGNMADYTAKKDAFNKALFAGWILGGLVYVFYIIYFIAMFALAS